MSAALGTVAGATNPWLLGGQALLGLGQSLFHRKRKALHLDPFSFNPNPNDPEIALRRKAALMDIQRAHASTVNEVGRAGLLGSSAAFGLFNQDQTQGDAALEDIPNSVYARQRQDALQLYRDEANFKRQNYLTEGGYGQQEHMAGLDALSGVGTNIGYGLDSLARKKRLLLAGSGGWNDTYAEPSYWGG